MPPPDEAAQLLLGHNAEELHQIKVGGGGDERAMQNIRLAGSDEVFQSVCSQVPSQAGDDQ